MKTVLFILALSFSAMAQTPYASSLSDLIRSNDEIECFAFYFDVRPEVIETNLEKYRLDYLTEVRNAGYNPKDFKDYIHILVPFDTYGRIIKKAPRSVDLMMVIIGNHDGKVVFDHKISD
jgi:hypothetical protein